MRDTVGNQILSYLFIFLWNHWAERGQITCPRSHKWVMEDGPMTKAGWLNSDTVKVHMAILPSLDKSS